MKPTPETDPFFSHKYGISRRQQRNFNEILLAIIVAIIMISLGRWLFLAVLPRFWDAEELSFFGNLFSEGFGIIITVIIVDRLNQRRAENELREELLVQVRSQSNDFALNALDRMKLKGWLSENDNLLQDKEIRNAKWQGADLQGINLQGIVLEDAILINGELAKINLMFCNLWGTNLSNSNLTKGNLSYARLIASNLFNSNLEGVNLIGASLRKSNLTEAYLSETNLEGANLSYANLSRADLFKANLNWAGMANCDMSRADLTGTKLTSASLLDANLMGAIISETTQFDETTVLPDGKHWTTETDITRFTDPNHPNFWRSDDPNSPAYRGLKKGIDGLDEAEIIEASVEELTLAQLVKREVDRYAANSFDGLMYSFLDNEQQHYMVVHIPFDRTKYSVDMIIMARVVGDKVIIDYDDVFDKKLYKALMVNAKIPREQIILAYEGEKVPE